MGDQIPSSDTEPRGRVVFAPKVAKVQEYYPDWEYISIGIDKDHIHLHMIIPPRYSVSEVVDVLKANTSREIKETFEF